MAIEAWDPQRQIRAHWWSFQSILDIRGKILIGRSPIGYQQEADASTKILGWTIETGEDVDCCLTERDDECENGN